jgi:4-oxalomesaconate tautomerase
MSSATPVMWMRGGTSKGGYFLADDLPGNTDERDRLLLRIMGSPDVRQIDGMGGADPLTSKVAVIRPSQRPGIDVDYLFLQVFVDRPIVSDGQNCGNILAGVGPFALERGLVKPQDGETPVRIFLENTQQTAVVRVSTRDGRVEYEGETRLDGVPGTAAGVPIEFRDTMGSTCGALLPTGNVTDLIDGITVTLIDNGMPCVIIRAADLGISGYETPAELEADTKLRTALEAIRLKAGPLMKLGDVSDRPVPKMTMVSASRSGASVSTRTFIPHRCHKSIGVFGAVSVATACLLPGAVGSDIAVLPPGDEKSITIEHPTGILALSVKVSETGFERAAVISTARKLMDGTVFA